MLSAGEGRSRRERWTRAPVPGPEARFAPGGRARTGPCQGTRGGYPLPLVLGEASGVSGRYGATRETVKFELYFRPRCQKNGPGRVWNGSALNPNFSQFSSRARDYCCH